jgi:hypothetical protein
MLDSSRRHHVVRAGQVITVNHNVSRTNLDDLRTITKSARTEHGRCASPRDAAITVHIASPQW